MNAFQAVRSGGHFGNRGHNNVGGLGRPEPVFGGFDILEVVMNGHRPRPLALFGAGAELRAFGVDGLFFHALTLSQFRPQICSFIATVATSNQALAQPMPAALARDSMRSASFKWGMSSIMPLRLATPASAPAKAPMMALACATSAAVGVNTALIGAT